MTPINDKNFLVEITPEVMDELNHLYLHSDDKPIAELHYSPYWKSTAQTPNKSKENNSDE